MKVTVGRPLTAEALGICAGLIRLGATADLGVYAIELVIDEATSKALYTAIDAEIHTQQIDGILDEAEVLVGVAAKLREWEEFEPPGLEEMLADFKTILHFDQLWVPVDDPTVAYAHPDDEQPAYVAGPVDPPAAIDTSKPTVAENESANHAEVARRYTDADLTQMLTLEAEAKKRGMTDIEVARHLNKRMLVPETSVGYLLDKARRRVASKK